ncbi:MAG: inositol monophosphatase [Deltaproteobacteria bacterium]|nr:inositol monophosphatase [Deltaproteobacteria bacterium]MBW1906258.1 inositol monophosphatase [Deltaproteobacteria bacterium]MBW2160531.1 inositol monophosphatase [Deltaproteobacteria bacterium]MBW2378789.1 inositol monophosphatase [Deltaproteobacteria bacterium]MBW2552041.1 inositol monophosphatase [Deltaproteobacteria bacterium]
MLEQNTPSECVETLALLRQLQVDSKQLLDRLQRDLKRQHTVGVNAKGDNQKYFDIAADEWIRRWLSEHFESGVVESEEQTGAFEFGSGKQGYRFIVDPVDGSDNFARGLPLSAISLAMLPRQTSLSMDGVLYALVGDTSGPGACVAARGNGAYSNSQRLRTSETRRLRDAFVSCELNHWAPDASLAEVMRTCSGVRVYGCASRALCMVAVGALDAHVDVRSRLTPESFLAASLLVAEAGGHICRLDGGALGPFQSLQDRTTLVAASTKELAEEIVNALAT